MVSTPQARGCPFCPIELLRVGLDRGDRVGLRVFVAGDAALRNVRQFLLEIVLREGKVRYDHVVGDLLAVEDLLRHPEGERRDARRDRGGPGGVAVLLLLLLPPLQFVLAIALDDGWARLTGSSEGLRRAVAVAALI